MRWGRATPSRVCMAVFVSTGSRPGFAFEALTADGSPGKRPRCRFPNRGHTAYPNAMRTPGGATRLGLLAAFVALVACRSKGDGPSPSPSDAPSGAAPVASALPAMALEDLPSAVTDRNCSVDDSAKVSPALEALLAALPTPIPERARKRFGFECGKKPAVLLAIDYGDEPLAKRALLHYAHHFLLPADPSAANALPVGHLVRRGSVVAIVVGEGNTISLGLRDRRGFGDGVPGYPRAGRGGSGSALPFVSKPGAFTAAQKARDYDFGCGEGLPATVRACADLALYDKAHGNRGPGNKPETYVGACVPTPWPTAKSAVEEACWLLWSPLGVAMGTVRSLGVSLEGIPLDKLRAQGATALAPAKAVELRYAILERGPGREVEYVDDAERSISEDGKETLSVRFDDASFVGVRATNDRVKKPLLVAAFARAGGLGP